MENSEFGKGFAYCLGLFLAHAERKTCSPSFWLQGAGDHILEIIIPDGMNHAQEFVERVKYLALPLDGYSPTDIDKEWVIQTAKNLLLEWDIKCGIDAVRGDYE